ncbi:MAG: hypothetical protein WA118_08335 [Carboxydocellales bacterium]
MAEVYISVDDRYRIYQAPVGKRNWMAVPAPVVKKNGITIVSDFEIDYGGGAIIFTTNQQGSDVVTVDATYTINQSAFTADPAQAPASNGPGGFVEWFSWLVNRIIALSGEANWWTAPAATIKTIWGKFHQTTGHTHTGVAGDGTKIAHTSLTSIGTNTHAQLDTHVAAAAPHSGHETPVGAQTKVDAHGNRTDNPHSVTAAQLGAIKSDGSIAMAGALTLPSDPTQDLHAVTKQYVDAMVQGLSPKESCRAATTANITLSGTQTIDGVDVIAGDRVLVKNQATGSQNGIYAAAAGAWSRSADANIAAEMSTMYTFVSEGTVNADSGWVLTTNDPITLGTTALVFTQFSGAGQITAGTGITKTGNTLDVGTASTARIVVNADNIDLAPAGTAGTYKSVTTDAYGRVIAGSNPTTLAGYGITDALRVASGSYTGDGAANRQITIGFQPKFILVWSSNGSDRGPVRIAPASVMQVINVSSLIYLYATTGTPGIVINSTGYLTGNTAANEGSCNKSTWVYYWEAWG